MYAVHIALSVVFLVVGLKPIKEASRYRFRKTQWTLLGFGLLGIGLVNLWLHEVWLLVLGGLLCLMVYRLRFN